MTAGLSNYCGDLLTIGTLALILVYIGVNAAELAQPFAWRRLFWSVCGLCGMGVLLWSFYNSVYPAPDFPNNLWPYCVLIWLIVGAVFVMFHPVLRKDH